MLTTNTTPLAVVETLAGYSKEELYFFEQNRKLIEKLRTSPQHEPGSLPASDKQDLVRH